jgi:uncharacterized protein (TIGR02145 family)
MDIRAMKIVRLILSIAIAFPVITISGCLDDLNINWGAIQGPGNPLDYNAPNIVTGVNDIDGNYYPGVQVGSQIWFFYDLRTTRYQNGDSIGTTRPAILDISEVPIHGYQWSYKGEVLESPIYGRYYTWYATTDSRGVCPKGWRVATVEDWNSLVNYLGGANVAGEKLKMGAGVWGDLSGIPNQVVFQAIPGGKRESNGEFIEYKTNGYWWATSSNDTPFGVSYSLRKGSIEVFQENHNKLTGLCIRCVKE